MQGVHENCGFVVGIVVNSRGRQGMVGAGGDGRGRRGMAGQGRGRRVTTGDGRHP